MEATETNWRANAIQLFLLSLASLFIELLAIRWLCGDFRSIAILSTFPLVACFVGLGVGFALGHDRWFKYAPVALFGMVVLIRTADFFNLGQYAYPTMAVYQWGQMTEFGLAMWITVFIFMLWIALVLAFPFATMALIGSRLGVLFNSMPPLKAYAIDITGAIVGSILFTAASFLCFPPGYQLLIPGAILCWYNRNALLAFAPVLVSIALCLIPFPTDAGIRWAPYFRLQETPVTWIDDKGQSHTAGVLVRVNQMFQQYFFPDPNLEVPDKRLSELMLVRRNYYALPYYFTQPKDVLVLGAGTGSDVMQAVKHGAEHVDAVEIDPVVISLGRKYNPTYSTDKVNLICNDARNYLHHCQKKYDLITVACLDSLAVTGMGSSVRIDSYVHTKESIARMLSLLKPNGLLVMSFGAGGGQWLRDRLYNTVRQAGGYDPVYLTDQGQKISWPAFVYVAGPSVKDGTFKVGETPGYEVQNIATQVPPTTKILQDDWPYLYVSPFVLDLPYMLLIGEILFLSLFVSRKLLLNHSNWRHWQMLFLGAGFLLVELQAISRLSLLYGATWITSAAVINGVLIMILTANFFVLKFPNLLERWLGLVYAALLLSILTNYMLPVNEMVNAAGSGIEERIGITFLTLFPLMMAGIVFSTSFSKVPVAGRALGFNLLGSVLGGLLELLSPYTGVRGLLLIALALYSCSAVCYYLASKNATTPVPTPD